MRRIARAAALPLVLLATVLVAGCTDGRLLANPAPTPHPIVTPAPTPERLPDPQPIVLPRDDGPHDRLTEWWYVTGHLVAADGRRFGFEDVIFRAERGGFPVSWASHLALTDETGQRFLYDQRRAIAELRLPTSFRAEVEGNRARGNPWVPTRLVEELKAQGVTVDLVWKGPLKEDDRDQQIALVENFTARKVSGICVAPLDSQALVRPVNSAAKAKVPVVVFDSGVKTEQIVSYVATDNFKGGQLGGEALAKELGEIGRAHV